MFKISSKTVFFFIAFLIIASAFFYKNWKGTWFVWNGDSSGYYTYLPATFIHHDLDSLTLTTFNRVKEPTEFKNVGEVSSNLYTGSVVNGKRLIMYTSGVAILQSSFFFMAHALAKPLGYEANGYTLPYKILVFFGNIVYVLLGLWYLRKILRGYDFSEWTVSLTLILIAFATNLYYFMVYSGYMAHSYLFALYAFLIWHTIQFYKKPQAKTIFFMGFFTGLIALIRPLDGLIAVVPLFYGVFSLLDLKQRFMFFFNHKTLVFIGLVGAILPILPQLFYWKHITGQWIYDSYSGFGFVYKWSQVKAGLIGFKNGWLAYTPIMFFAIIGIVLMWIKKESRTALRLPILLFLPIYICFIYFWYCYNYINGFGSRPMVDTYALLAIPLSIFIEKIIKKPWVLSIWLALAAFLTWLNVFQTYQSTVKLFLPEESTAAFWWASMGKTKLTYQDLVAYDSNELQPLPTETTMGKVLLSNNFEDTTRQSYTQKQVYEGKYAGEVKPNSFGPTAQLTGKGVIGYKWIKIKGWFYVPEISVGSVYDKTNLVVHIHSNEEDLKWRSMSIDSKINNPGVILGGEAQKWGYVWFYVKIPTGLKETDNVSAYIWNLTNHTLYVDNFQIELHR